MPADANCYRTREPSLTTITRNFMELKDHCGGVVDLRDAADILRVPKRRLYDVVNVLQGVGLMERVRRNTVSWEEDPAEDDESLRDLRCECDALLKEEASLDAAIKKLAAAAWSAKSETTAYVHLRDIRAMEGLEGQTLIAVTSLPDEISSIDVGGSPERGMFEMLVKSEGRSPLRGFLCPAGFCSFTDVMDLACGDGPSPSDDLDSGSPSVVVKQEEIEFENDVLDCILDALFDPSRQHSKNSMDLLPTPSPLKEEDGLAHGFSEQEMVDFLKKMGYVLRHD
ncbi:transcription factor E2F/dimerization partner [Ancylostoma caninum]|uniref:Transcription factor E2F/dimerization partner n=1 Tax=Ancylostoma caninum TaxID=29170 RepID=A0A368GLN8_ANCCA|nr:transcription factor E2F/dimerization partner [Ancylostoma caninum]